MIEVYHCDARASMNYLPSYRSSRFAYHMSFASLATSIIPSHYLGREKLIHSLLGIEAALSAVLDSTER
jgi:hypothetical protein